MMKQVRKRFLALLACAALCLPQVVSPAAATDGVTVWSDQIGGSTAKIVSIQMKQGRTGEIMLANDSVVSTTSGADLVSSKNAQANTRVVAAVNGGFFNAYTSGTPSYPSNCPTIFHSIVTNGKLILAGGQRPVLGFTADGTPMIDRVKFLSSVKLGNGFACGNWGINYYYDDPEAIMLFNDHLTLPVTIPSSSTMVFIQNKRVTKIMPGEKLWVPKDTDVLVYNSAIAEIEKGYNRFPEVDMSAEITLTAEPTRSENAAAWSSIETAVAGGPMILLGGQNVTASNTDFTEDKLQPDYVAQRTFCGLTSNGILIFGTANASFNQIATWLQAQGVVDALSMDGGASSMLYEADAGFLTSPGRALASGLAIVDRTGAGGLPTESNVRAANADEPSSWAASSVQQAISAGLVPESLQGDYRAEITRIDFCTLMRNFMSRQPDFMSWLSPETPSFPDTKSDDVEVCARLGIVSGDPNGNFRPYGTLTRAEAARILSSAAQLMGVSDTGADAGFADSASFAAWAAPFINYCGVNGIMNGDEKHQFNPTGTYTREQAIITVLNMANGL